jgi:hypothetical protein
MDCDRDWFIIEFAASLSMDIVKVVCIKIPCIVLITGLVGAALCISERLYLVVPAITMECRYYNIWCNNQFMYTVSDFFCLKVQGLFLEKFFSSSFTVVLSSECLHALDLGLEVLCLACLFWLCWSRSQDCSDGHLFWFDSRGFFQLGACRIWSLCSCWKFQYFCFVYVY